MKDLLNVIGQTGQHAVVYGERGVGKTSMAATMTDILSGHVLAARVNCDVTDTFGTLWHKALDEIQLMKETQGAGFTAEKRQAFVSAAGALPEANSVTPNDVRRVLTMVGKVGLFFDEFDRLEDLRAKTLFADTIKGLSDHLVPATVVLVGVADTVEELIAEHRSVERALAQIHMPRMSVNELAEIVHRLETDDIDMVIDSDATEHITRLSQGLPHYTHLLTQNAAMAAVDRGDRHITMGDVRTAMRWAIDKSQESVTASYHRATFSPRRTLYAEVLLACALLKGDEGGYFTAGDVRAPLSAIMRVPYDIPAFAAHLKDLSDGKRGGMLQRTGEERRRRYRFVNPLMQPYVIMRGVTDGLIGQELVQEFLT
ncbi:MAG: hypothetical protein QOF51_4122 [Chloroflexota bacterium]|nr:hypothetical protein [Chloroflexota bacterium]